MSDLHPRSASLAALFSAPVLTVIAPPEPVIDLDAIRTAVHAEGFAAGVTAADGDMAPVRLRLAAAAAALEAACRIDAQALHAPFVALVTRLAEVVIAAELALAPQHVTALVAAALDSIVVDSSLVLRLHPDDAALLAGETLPLPIIADSDVARGAVFVEAPRFVVADSFEARLAAVLEVLP